MMFVQLNSSIKVLLKQNTKYLYLRYYGTQTNCRNYCTENIDDRPVRVRFAPSPTGILFFFKYKKRRILFRFLFSIVDSKNK